MQGRKRDRSLPYGSVFASDTSQSYSSAPAPLHRSCQTYCRDTSRAPWSGPLPDRTFERHTGTLDDCWHYKQAIAVEISAEYQRDQGRYKQMWSQKILKCFRYEHLQLLRQPGYMLQINAIVAQSEDLVHHGLIAGEEESEQYQW
jgi:hypothetical protein